MRVGFHCDSFSLRGGTVATIAYARALKRIGYESVIIKCDDQTSWIIDRNPPSTTDGLEIIRYKASDSLREVLSIGRVDALYVLNSGTLEDRFKEIGIPVWVHSVFPTDIDRIGGNRFAAISDWLSKEAYNNRVETVPHIIDAWEQSGCRDSWRAQHGIPSNAVVIGSMGGTHTFDLKIARDSIAEVLESRADIYFCSLNHAKFISHRKAVFLKGTDCIAEKRSFINACDAMLHGRTQGETFGLACGEFAAAGKPVFAWRGAPEKHHLYHFSCHKMQYSNKSQLVKLLKEFDPDDWDPRLIQSKCSQFNSEHVIDKFEKVFIKDDKNKTAVGFSALDRIQILKRRIRRSVESRLSRINKDASCLIIAQIDPKTGYPMEE